MAGFLTAALADDKSFALISALYGKSISIDLGRISGNEIKAWWYNPRNGRTLSIGNYENKEPTEFRPHASGRGSDWILIWTMRQMI